MYILRYLTHHFMIQMPYRQNPVGQKVLELETDSTNRAVWITRFGGIYGPVARQQTAE